MSSDYRRSRFSQPPIGGFPYSFAFKGQNLNTLADSGAHSGKLLSSVSLPAIDKSFSVIALNIQLYIKFTSIVGAATFKGGFLVRDVTKMPTPPTVAQLLAATTVPVFIPSNINAGPPAADWAVQLMVGEINSFQGYNVSAHPGVNTVNTDDYGNVLSQGDKIAIDIFITNSVNISNQQGTFDLVLQFGAFFA